MEKRNIAYIKENSSEFNSHRHILDVFYPADINELKNVVVFIHGGTWMNGSKEIYQPLGRNLSEKGVVAVVLNYRLGENVTFKEMAEDCANALKWVYNNIHSFGGDKTKITVSGHSAGGHLAALITLDSSYFTSLDIANPAKKVILIDAFGLNIGSFIQSHGSFYLEQIEKIFTRDPKMWQKASPSNFVGHTKTPFLILLGGSTYPIIKMDNEIFLKEFKQYDPYLHYHVIPGKSHVEMVTQLENKNNSMYSLILDFINEEQLSLK